MTGFDILYDEKCIHEETGFDVDCVEDMYDAVLRWWNGDANEGDGMNAEDVLVKLFVQASGTTALEEEDITMAEIISIKGC